MSSTNATRQRRREAKAARRRKRLATGERPRRLNMLALAGQGAERLEAAFKNAPLGFGKAKPKTPEVEALAGAQEDQVAA